MLNLTRPYLTAKSQNQNNIYLCFLEGEGCLDIVDACETSDVPLFRESEALPTSSAGASIASLSGMLFFSLQVSVYIFGISIFFSKPWDSSIEKTRGYIDHENNR